MDEPQRGEDRRMAGVVEQVVSETTREILHGHILRILKEVGRPLPRGRLINRLPCGFTNGEAVDALNTLVADGAVTLTQLQESSDPDFAIVALAA